MITVFGNTYPHRELFKKWAGRYDGQKKSWTFYHLSAEHLEHLSQLAGCIMLDSRQPKKPPSTFHRSGEPLLFGDSVEFLGAFRDPDPIAFFEFSSLGAFCDHVESLVCPVDQPGMSNRGWSETPKYVNFCGTASLAEAISLARNGWTEGFDLTKKFTIPHAQNKRRSHGLTGRTVNVGKMLAGNPAHMTRRIQKPKHKNITLFVETCVWRGITAENNMLRAILIAGVIDTLETQGYRCRVVAVCSLISRRDAGATAQFAINIKDFGERLSLLDLTFALGHPSLLRRFVVCCIGVIPQIDTAQSGTGLISESFDEIHKPPVDSYYFKQLPPTVPQTEYADPMKMLPHILPHDLPIKLQTNQ